MLKCQRLSGSNEVVEDSKYLAEFLEPLPAIEEVPENIELCLLKKENLDESEKTSLYYLVTV